MEPSDIYRLLARRLRRGLVLFPLLWLIATVAGGVALMTPGGRPWAAAAILAALLLGLGVDHVRRRDAVARTICWSPALVYWAHPARPGPWAAQEPPPDGTLLRLHLRDGTDFEAGLPAAEMRVFVAWLRENNPAIRWGAYD